MPLDQLLAALEREAHTTADRLLSQARDEAAQLTSAADEALARRRDLSVTTRVGELQAAMEQALADIGRENRGDELRARERLLARVFGAVRAALPAVLDQPNYRASLLPRIAAALACVDESEAVVLRCPASLVTALQTAVTQHPQARIQADDTAGSGFRLATADGALEVDDTLESRLEKSATSMAREAMQRLEQPA